jgi:transposase InsO family protein
VSTYSKLDSLLDGYVFGVPEEDRRGRQVAEARAEEAKKELRGLREENARLSKVIRNIDITCEEGGESELFFGHVAHLLRQDGFAQGPNMDEFFAGTNLEKRS